MPSSFPVNAGVVIQLRDKHGWTQQELADQAGVGKRSIERAENGEALSQATIKRIADALNVLPEEIIANGFETDPLRESFAPYLTQLRNRLRTYVVIDLRIVDEGQLEDDDLPQLEQLFVPPYLLTEKKKPEETPPSWEKQTLAIDGLKRNRHSLVIGEAGSGKSTFVNYFALQLAQPHPTIFSRQFSDPIPLVFVLRDLRITADTTLDTLLQEFCRQAGCKSLTSEQVMLLIRMERAALIFDGIDEIGRGARVALRRILWDVVVKFPKNIVLATTRPAGNQEMSFHENIVPWDDESPQLVFDDESRDGAYRLPAHLQTRIISTSEPDERGFVTGLMSVQYLSLFYLAPFDDEQIRTFSQNWYAKRLDSDDVAEIRSKEMWDAVTRSRSTLLLGRIPNMLTIMALLHERTRVLPDGKARLYAAISRAYLVAIEQSRKLARPEDLPGELDEQKLWLGRVAWEIQLRRVANEFRNESVRVPSESILEVSTKEIVEWVANEQQSAQLIQSHSNNVTKETIQQILEFITYVRDRAGLLIERSKNRFCFIHLSFVEYFAAFHLVKHFTALEIPVDCAPNGANDAPSLHSSNLSRLAIFPIWRETLIFAFEQLFELSPTDSKQLFQSVFCWFTSAQQQTPDTKEAISARSQQLLLLARLGENRHTKVREYQTQIREACLTWALRVDPLDIYGWKRESIFRDEWLTEINNYISWIALRRKLIENSISVTRDSLVCRSFGLNHEDCEWIANQFTDLTELDLGDNNVGDEGCTAIASRLRRLRVLRLRKNGISDEGVSALSKYCRQVETIDLEENEVTDVGAALISRAFPHLKDLDLQHNKIGDDGAISLSDRVNLLQSLHLKGNLIGNTGVLAIARKVTSLRTLRLRGNCIDDQVKTEIRNILHGKVGDLYI